MQRQPTAMSSRRQSRNEAKRRLSRRQSRNEAKRHAPTVTLIVPRPPGPDAAAAAPFCLRVTFRRNASANIRASWALAAAPAPRR